MFKYLIISIFFISGAHAAKTTCVAICKSENVVITTAGFVPRSVIFKAISASGGSKVEAAGKLHEICNEVAPVFVVQHLTSDSRKDLYSSIFKNDLDEDQLLCFEVK